MMRRMHGFAKQELVVEGLRQAPRLRQRMETPSGERTAMTEMGLIER